MKLVRYVSVFIILTAIGILYDKYKKKWGFLDTTQQNEKYIQNYLLNEKSILNGKPIIWIHNKYEVNSRNWLSFYSRNSKELNQPYKKLCIDTMIKFCGEDFNICLVDDNSFQKLIPGWTIDLEGSSEPVKTHLRDLAMVKLIYYYGGIIMPSATIVLKNLKDMYYKMCDKNDCFVGELTSKGNVSEKIEFFPSNRFIGCKKNSAAIRKLMLYLEKLNDYSNEYEFMNKVNRFLFKLIDENNVCKIDGKFLGSKTKTNKKVSIEDLMSDTNIHFDEKIVAIILPDADLLRRTKYNWFVRLNAKQLLKANNNISKNLLLAIGK
jgi:hypothetical protein